MKRDYRRTITRAKHDPVVTYHHVSDPLSVKSKLGSPMNWRGSFRGDWSKVEIIEFDHVANEPAFGPGLSGEYYDAEGHGRGYWKWTEI